MTAPVIIEAPTLAITDTVELESLAIGWLKGYRSKRTVELYRRDLNRWLVECIEAGLDPLHATADHLEWWARLLEERDGFAISSVGRMLAAVSSWYRYCERRGVIDKNPALVMRRPKPPSESPTLGLDKDEARALLAAAESPRDRLLISLLMVNGLRVSEACNARLEDLEEHSGHRTLMVTRKGGRRERVPLPPVTVAAVEDCIEGRESGPLMLTTRGNPLDRFAAYQIVRRLVRAAGITKRISPHSLRHTCATLALQSGVPLHKVQDLLSHSDPRITRRYDRQARSLDGHGVYALAGALAQ